MFETVLLAFLLVRCGIYAWQKRKWAQGHAAVAFYFGVFAINSVTYLFDWNPNFYFVHIATPTLVSVALVWKRARGLLFSAVTGVVALLGYIWTDYTLMLVLNYTALFLLLREGILLAKSRSEDVARSPVYVVLAFDLFATMLTLVLKFTPFDWTQSELTDTFHFLRLAIFSTTLILIHAKLRRFVIA